MKKILCLFLLLSFFNSIGQATDDYTTSSILKEGQQLPACSYKNLENKSLNLENLKGKIVLVNFFATWCAPCMIEMPFLQSDIWNVYKDNLNFTLLSFGRGHSDEEVQKFIKAKSFTFPIYSDKDKSVYDKFATKYIPRNYLFDKTGKLVYASTGFSKEEFEILKEKIKLLLENDSK
jgi:peroxiredoxin